MNRADVRVIQRRCGLGLTSKPLQGLAVVGHAFRNEVKDDDALQPRVFALVHHSPAAATELLDDAVMRDGPPDHADAILGALRWEVNATRIAGPAVDATAKSRPVFGATTSAVLPLQALFYCSFAYSALASFRMGMSESASFQSVRKCL